MMVRKPEEGDPETAARIREAASAYTVSARQADYADADGHRKVGDYRKGIEDLETAKQEERAAEPDPARRKQTSKRRPAAADAGRDGAAGSADEAEEAVE